MYADWADIEEHIPSGFQGNVDLRNYGTTVQQACEDLVTGMLGTVYSLPVTSAANPIAYRRIVSLCARLTAARALQWFHANDDPEERNAHADGLEKQVMDELARILSGEDELSDASVATDGPGLDPEDGYDSLTSTEQDYLDAWFARSDEW